MLDAPPQGGPPVPPGQENLPALQYSGHQLAHRPPQKQVVRYRLRLVGFLSLLLLVTGLLTWAMDADVWAATSATVTITPQSSAIQQIVTVPTQATRLSSSLTRQSTVAVTGHQEQQAHQATGILIFSNLADFPQTIPAGTMATGANGVSVITDTTAIVQAGNPPAEATVDIPAHARYSGASGNLAARDIWLTPCCANITIIDVVVSNLFAFSGGQDAARYRVVGQHDVDAAATALETALEPAVQDALQ